ncbi:MAG: Ig-like domain-containing protein, partial [Deltaproteobacteria bacterium]
VEYSVDGGATWGGSFTAVEGVNTVAVRQTDAAGNTGPATGLTFTLDTAAPAAPGLALATDGGSSNSDGLASDPTMNVTGLEPGAVWEYSLDGGSSWNAGSGGSFSLTANTAYAAGDIQVRQTDLAGNTSSIAANPAAVVIDTVAPTPTISLGSVTADNNLTVGEAEGIVTITGTVGGDGAPGDTVTLTLANAFFSADYTGVVAADGTFSINVFGAALAADADKTVIASVASADAAGNVGSAVAAQGYTVDAVTVDIAPPTVTIVVDDAALRIGETATVTITFSEAVTGFSNADLLVANGTLSPVSTADGGITWLATLTPDASVEDASNLITLNDASLSDLAGNTNSGSVDSNNYAIDTLAPVPTITLNASITADDVINIAEAGSDVTISGTVGGDAQAGDVVTLTVSGGAFTGTFSGFVLADKTFSVDLAGFGLLADADRVIEAVLTTHDAAGNAGTATATKSYSVDLVAPVPTIALESAITADDIVNINEAGGNVAIRGTVGGDAQVGDTVTLTVNGNTFFGLVQADKSFSIDVAGADLIADSDRIVDAVVTTHDAAGNPGVAADAEGYAIDTQRPTATVVVDDAA